MYAQLSIPDSALVQKVRHNVDRESQACILRNSERNMISMPSGRDNEAASKSCPTRHGLSHVSATEGTERGRRGAEWAPHGWV